MILEENLSDTSWRNPIQSNGLPSYEELTSQEVLQSSYLSKNYAIVLLCQIGCID